MVVLAIVWYALFPTILVFTTPCTITSHDGNYTFTVEPTDSDRYHCVIGCSQSRGYNASKLLGECASLSDFRKTMTERRNRLREKCKTHAQLPTFEPKFRFTSNLAWCEETVDSNTERILCGITSGTSECRVTLPSPNATLFLLYQNPFARAINIYNRKIINLHEWRSNREILTNHRYINPEDVSVKRKLLDETSYKILRLRAEDLFAPDPENPYQNPPIPTFTEFIRSIVTGVEKSAWASVSTRCGACYDKFRYFLDVDNLQCDVTNMVADLKRQGSDLARSSGKKTLSRDGESSIDMDTIITYFRVFSFETLDRFVKYYEDDCELFDLQCSDILCAIKSHKINMSL